jgi:hypothetical protein
MDDEVPSSGSGGSAGMDAEGHTVLQWRTPSAERNRSLLASELRTLTEPSSSTPKWEQHLHRLSERQQRGGASLSALAEKQAVQAISVRAAEHNFPLPPPPPVVYPQDSLGLALLLPVCANATLRRAGCPGLHGLDVQAATPLRWHARLRPPPHGA